MAFEKRIGPGTERRLRNWRATIAAALIVSLGCATIEESRRYEDRQIRSWKASETLPERTLSIRPALSGDRKALTVQVQEQGACREVVNTEVDRTEVIERTARPPGYTGHLEIERLKQFIASAEAQQKSNDGESLLRYSDSYIAGARRELEEMQANRPGWSPGWMAAGGALGVAVLGAVLASGTPIATTGRNGDLTPAGLAAIGGGALGIMLPIGLVDLFRAGTTRNHLGPTVLPTPGTPVACNEAPAAGRNVAVIIEPSRPNSNRAAVRYSQEQRTASKLTSGDGRAEFSSDALHEALYTGYDLFTGTGQLRLPEFDVEVEGTTVEASDVLRPLYTDWARAHHARVEEERRQAGAREVAAGCCSDENQRAMQLALQQVRTVLEDGTRHEFTVHVHDLLVASPPATARAIKTGYGGQYHVFVLGPGKVDVEVETQGGSRSTLRSPYEALARSTGLLVSSKIFQANPLTNYRIDVKGEGCALLVVARKNY